jgi:ketosteroid isomerase-like protein
MKSLIIFLCPWLLFSLCPLGSAQQSKHTATITIEVTDQTGAAIPGAHIRIVPTPPTACHGLATRENGKTVVELEAGTYDIFVNATAFVGVTKRITITDTSSQTLTAMLRVGGGSRVEVERRWTADEETIWKLEDAYWKAVQAFDDEGLKNLLHPDPVFWLDGRYVLSGNNAAQWMNGQRDRGLHLEEFTIREEQIRVTGDTAVTYYRLISLWANEDGVGKPETRSFTHTWVKAGKSWKLIGEMSTTLTSGTVRNARLELLV